MAYFNDNQNDKEYLLHPVPGETTRQTVERNYYKCLMQQQNPASQMTQMPTNNATIPAPQPNQALPKLPPKGSNPYNLPQPNWNDVVVGAMVGIGDGTLGGIERYLNVLTNGLYGNTLDKYGGNAYTNRQNRIQQLANDENLGVVLDIANTAIDTSATFAPFAYGASKVKKIKI